MMSASSVADNVNKYRHGVLIGNFTEDKFGNDLSAKVPLPSFRDHNLMSKNYPPPSIFMILHIPSTSPMLL